MTLIVLPGGQIAQKGIAVNIPIDMNEQLSYFPNQVHNSGSVLVSFERPNNEPVTLPRRLHAVYAALLWLKQKNPLYEHVDVSHLELSLPLIRNDNPDCCTDMIHEEFGLTLKDTVLSENQANLESANISACTLPVALGRPVNLKDLPCGEEKAFPWLFPYGKNGISADRPCALSILKYFQTRLFNVDPRWRTDIPYIMSALNQHEWTVLTSLVSTNMRTQKPIGSCNGCFTPITAADLNNARTDPV
jgi:hypothetical protein